MYTDELDIDIRLLATQPTWFGVVNARQHIEIDSYIIWAASLAH